MRDLRVVELFPAAAYTNNGNGSAVDVSGFEQVGAREFIAFLTCGAASGTSPTLDVKIQESDSSTSGFADISGAAFTQLTGAGSEHLRFVARKRYVRAVRTVGGTSPSFTFSVTLVGRQRAA